MKHLIHRKDTAGFSKDPTRVLAAFLTSNALASVANDRLGELLKATSAIPKHQGDVKDEAVSLVSYLPCSPRVRG